jgi:hypothetical protein
MGLHKSSKGVSTILGTMIFIGILFTAVIPMMLVMNQADTIYEKNKLEITRADDERDRENMIVYPIPSLTEPEMDVTLINTGEVSAQVVRIWINDTSYPVAAQISTFSSVEVGPFPAAKVEGAKYEVRATSARSNVYTSEIGTLRYEGGEWVSETLGFNLIFPSRPGKGARTNNWLNELRITIEQDGDILYANSTMYWAISASEKFFQLDQAGDYQIIVYIWCKGPPSQHWEKVYDSPHSIDWPEGDPIVELNFVINGDHLELQ